MSKFPIVEQLSVPQAAGYNAPQVVSADVTAVPEATAKLGQTLEKTAGVITEIHHQKLVQEEQQQKFNYSLAKVNATQQIADLKNQLNNDPDYANIPTKYQAGITQIKSDLSKGLGNNKFAPLLNAELDAHAAQNFDDVQKIAEHKQQQESLTTAFNMGQKNLDIISRTNDPKVFNATIAAQKELYNAAFPNDPLKAAQANKSFAQDVAEMKLSQKDPYQRLALLNEENKKQGSNVAAFLSADKRIALYNETVKEVKALEEKKIDTSMVNLALNNNLTLDPTLPQNQRAVDTVWQQKQQDLTKQGATVQQILDSSFDIVGKTGIMPTSIKSALNANILNGTPQQRVNYSTYLTNAAKNNPKILNGLDPKTTAMAFSIANKIDAGLSSQQAVEYAINDQNEAKKQNNEALANAWKEQSKKINTTDKISSQLESESGFHPFRPSPQVSPQMIDEYNRLSKDYFINQRVDLQTANQMAEKTVKSNWGISEIGGRKYVKYAPETVYGNGGDTSWIHQQLEKETKTSIKDLDVEVDHSTVTSSKPSYFIFKKNSFGGIDAILGDDNLPKKFQPNYQQHNAEKIQEDLSKEKEKRQMRDIITLPLQLLGEKISIGPTSFNLPQDAQGPNDIKKALDDEQSKHPTLYKGIDTDKESKKIYDRYYKNRGDLAYNLPEDNGNIKIEDIQSAISDEKRKHPNLYQGIDTEKEADKIFRRYYKNSNNIG